MIEKMQRLTLVCLPKDRDRSLDALRDLAVMHITAGDHAESADFGKAARARERLDKLMLLLGQYAGDVAELPPEFAGHGPWELARFGEEIMNRQAHLRDRQDELHRAAEQLEPWGAFSPEQLDDLRAAGLDIRLCACPPADLPNVPDPAAIQLVNSSDALNYFAVVSPEPIEVPVPEVALPDISLAEARSELAHVDHELGHLEARLKALAAGLDGIREAYAELADRCDFLAARDAMGDAESFAYLTGYIPARRADDVRQAAKAHGWALLLDDPEEDDRHVPTLLRLPKWLNVAMPIFDFIGVRPGYREFDVSLWFLIFLTIFFAMIFGDGGYGILISAGALALLFRQPPGKRTEARLLLLFGVSTLVWGWLQGNWFGIDRAAVPPVMRGVEWFWADKNVMYLCFLLGAIHLTIGHVWRVLAMFPSPRFLAQVGWAVAVWANFFLASQLVAERPAPSFLIWLYVAAAVLIVLFTAPSKKIFGGLGKGLGEIAGNGVGSFVDVVSYIRLFAVGLSGLYVARSFNNMGVDLFGETDAAALARLAGLLVGVLVILFGHLLNLSLCGLGVLVHGIRLNTLEFSNHIGIEWAGIIFRPFARRARDRD